MLWVDENNKPEEMARRWNDGKSDTTCKLPLSDSSTQIDFPSTPEYWGGNPRLLGCHPHQQSIDILKMLTLFTQAKCKQPGKSVLYKSHKVFQSQVAMNIGLALHSCRWLPVSPVWGLFARVLLNPGHGTRPAWVESGTSRIGQGRTQTTTAMVLDQQGRRVEGQWWPQQPAGMIPAARWDLLGGGPMRNSFHTKFFHYFSWPRGEKKKKKKQGEVANSHSIRVLEAHTKKQ